jgi:hypothetical protein
MLTKKEHGVQQHWQNLYNKGIYKVALTKNPLD